ncbi:FtsK/SpoIIIE domain-containing protein [Leucobacter sp. BZR 635]
MSAHALPPAVDGRPVYGIDTRSLAGVGMPTTGLGVVAGPSGAGLSTATRSCVRAVERWAAARGESVERILLTFARERWEPKAGPAAWAAPGLPADDAAGRGEAEAEAAAQSADIVWDRVAHGVEAVSGLSRALIEALGGRAPREPPRLVGSVGGGSEAPPRVHEGERLAAAGEPTRSPLGAATRRIIVVECPAQAEDTVALPLLVALAKTARHAPALVLFEYETGTGGAVWDLLTALKQPTWGLSLQPDEGEGQTPFREPLGRVTRADFPPGRGYAIERGRTVPVQVALP